MRPQKNAWHSTTTRNLRKSKLSPPKTNLDFSVSTFTDFRSLPTIKGQSNYPCSFNRQGRMLHAFKKLTAQCPGLKGLLYHENSEVNMQISTSTDAPRLSSDQPGGTMTTINTTGLKILRSQNDKAMGRWSRVSIEIKRQSSLPRTLNIFSIYWATDTNNKSSSAFQQQKRILLNQN